MGAITATAINPSTRNFHNCGRSIRQIANRHASPPSSPPRDWAAIIPAMLMTIPRPARTLRPPLREFSRCAREMLSSITRYMARPCAPPKELPARPEISKVWWIAGSSPLGPGTGMPSMPVSVWPWVAYSTRPSMAKKTGVQIRVIAAKRQKS
ncbi:hypothetical protein D3C81_1775750 [compost metagenome]